MILCTIVILLAIREVVGSLSNYHVMSGRSIQPFRHLQCQYLSIIASMNYCSRWCEIVTDRQIDREQTEKPITEASIITRQIERRFGAGQLSQCFSLSRRSMVLFFHVLPMYDNVHCINNLVIRPIKICSVSFSHVN